MESSNRSLNKYYIGAIKNISLFEHSINNLINLYENEHKIYASPKFSVANAIHYYIKNNNVKSLITFKDLMNIYEKYAEYKETKELLLNKDYYYNEEKIFIDDIKNKSSFNDYEADYISDSSIDI